MSRASKIFFGSSILLTVGTVWGVHYLQKQESENMYQGVVKDEARLKAKATAQALLSAALPASIAPSSPAELLPPPASSTALSGDVSLPPAPARPSSSSSSSSAKQVSSTAYNLSILSSRGAPTTSVASNTPPLNTPSAPVQQPAPVIDEDCPTCIISPPPQLVEAQSAEERRRDREMRQREYEQQKDLGRRLEAQQGVGTASSVGAGGAGGGRMV